MAMDSLQRVIVQSTSPLLLVNAGGLILVVLLSVSILVPLANWVSQRHDYQALTRFYEDADGVTIEEPRRHNPNRIPIAIHVSFVVINALLSITRACVLSPPTQAVETWLQCAIAVSPLKFRHFHRERLTDTVHDIRSSLSCKELPSALPLPPRLDSALACIVARAAQ